MKELIDVTAWAKCKENDTEVAMNEYMVNGDGKYICRCYGNIRDKVGKLVGLKCRPVWNCNFIILLHTFTYT